MAAAPIAIASDHAGFDLKQALIEHLQAAGIPVLDLGTNSRDSRSEEHTSELQSH